MKIVTANRLTDGVVVYRAEDGGWTTAFDLARSFTPEAAADALAAALDESRLVVGAYLVEVGEAGFTRRERQRETIRARGPSVGHSLDWRGAEAGDA
jgi:hypothetical protein